MYHKITFSLCIFILIFFINFNHSYKPTYLEEVVAEHKFNIMKWELKSLSLKLLNIFKDHSINESDVIIYLDRKDSGIRSYEVEKFVEDIISNEVKHNLKKEILFPPVSFIIHESPKVLILSPRDEIILKKAILLKPNLSLEIILDIEEKISNKEYSVLILNTGGFASYPSIVQRPNSYSHLTKTVAHEWLHQYLFFFPLGRSYFSGGEMVTLNESLADLFASEISKNLLSDKYQKVNEDKRFFNFMRETRIKVEDLLAKGLIFEAEEYMFNRTKEINQLGYNVRKINQAYFAFNGSYALSPGSLSEIDDYLIELRKSYSSYGELIHDIKSIDNIEVFNEFYENKQQKK